MYKLVAWFILLLTSIIVFYPILIMKGCHYTSAYIGRQREVPQTDNNDIAESEDLIVKLYITEKNEIVRLPLEHYVKGVVAGEMPAAFEMEALKAQAVAARTYVVNRMSIFGYQGCRHHAGADVCDNSGSCQAWMSESQMRERWGWLDYNRYWDKISTAVDDTAGRIIVYDDVPIDPLYHSTSGGKTENSEEVFQTKLPYLRSVISEGEEVSPRFSSTVRISKEDFVEKFKSVYPNSDITPRNVEEKVKVLEYSEGGRIMNISIGGVVVKGTEFRKLYELNSSNIRIYYSGNTMTITTLGFGHGVGMSQWGANVMAQNGNSYEDILYHYYKDVDIIKISDIY